MNYQEFHNILENSCTSRIPQYFKSSGPNNFQILSDMLHIKRRKWHMCWNVNVFMRTEGCKTHDSCLWLKMHTLHTHLGPLTAANIWWQLRNGGRYSTSWNSDRYMGFLQTFTTWGLENDSGSWLPLVGFTNPRMQFSLSTNILLTTNLLEHLDGSKSMAFRWPFNRFGWNTKHCKKLQHILNCQIPGAQKGN